MARPATYNVKEMNTNYALYLRECKLINKTPIKKESFITLAKTGLGVTDIVLRKQGGKGTCVGIFRDLKRKYNISYVTIGEWYRKGVTQDEMEERLILMGRQHEKLNAKVTRFKGKIVKKAKLAKPKKVVKARKETQLTFKKLLLKWITKLLG